MFDSEIFPFVMRQSKPRRDVWERHILSYAAPHLQIGQLPREFVSCLTFLREHQAPRKATVHQNNPSGA